MRCLYVLFDAHCELCVRCRNWLMKQRAFVPLIFIAFQSDEAHHRFPSIDTLNPGEQLLVISDEGAVYRGAHAWIVCLWALENYREHAQRLAYPALLPFARAACELLSRNRFFLSDAMRRLASGREAPQRPVTKCSRVCPQGEPSRSRQER